MTRVLMLAATCFLLAACAGFSAYEQGRQLMMSGDVERGLAKLKEAAEAAPNNYDYQQTYERDRTFVVSKYSPKAAQRAALRFRRPRASYRKALRWGPGPAAGRDGRPRAARRNPTWWQPKIWTRANWRRQAQTACRAGQDPSQRS